MTITRIDSKASLTTVEMKFIKPEIFNSANSVLNVGFEDF